MYSCRRTTARLCAGRGRRAAMASPTRTDSEIRTRDTIPEVRLTSHQINWVGCAFIRATPRADIRRAELKGERSHHLGLPAVMDDQPAVFGEHATGAVGPEQ